MTKKQREDAILEILKKQGYVTVKYLCDMLHYSSATINRDLNDLQSKKLIKRSYGGVELVKTKAVPLIMRFHKAKKEKRVIAKRAAEFVTDGDRIFIDGSSTTQYMAQYLINKKDLTVISNNAAIITFLCEHNVNCICLGGSVMEIPSVLGGEITVENASKYMADKAFLSVGALTEEGVVARGYYLLHKVMLKNSKRSFLLIDHEKINQEYTFATCTLEDIDTVISDYDFTEHTRSLFPKTKFVSAK